MLIDEMEIPEPYIAVATAPNIKLAPAIASVARILRTFDFDG